MENRRILRSLFACGWTAIFLLRVLGIESQQKGLHLTYFVELIQRQSLPIRTKYTLQIGTTNTRYNETVPLDF